MRAPLSDLHKAAMSSNPTERAIFSLLGATIAFVNIPVIILIFASPALQKCKELVLIGGLCFVDALLAMSNSVSGLDRLIAFPNDTDKKVHQMECFFKYYVIAFFFANLLVGIMTLLVSTERFVAVFWPLHYRHSYTRRKGICVMTGAICFCALTFCGAYIYQTSTPNTSISAMCYTAFIYPPLLSNLLVSIRISTLAVGILLYVPISIRVCHLKVTSRKHVVFIASNPSSTRLSFHSSAAQKRNINFTVTIGLTCMSTFVFLFIPDLIINFDMFSLQAYHILFYRASLLKAVINLFLYTLRHRELRKEIMLRLFNYYC